MMMIKVLPIVFFLIESTGIQFTYAVKNIDCPIEQIKVTALVFPPYVVRANSSKYKGIAHDFVKEGLEKCFSHCKLSPPIWTFVNNTEDLIKSVATNSTDIALPIPSCIEYDLEDTDDWSSVNQSAHFVFENMITSPGLSYVVHTENFNFKARREIILRLLGIWPIVVFCLLLAGTSGIFVWALVSNM